MALSLGARGAAFGAASGRRAVGGRAFRPGTATGFARAATGQAAAADAGLLGRHRFAGYPVAVGRKRIQVDFGCFFSGKQALGDGFGAREAGRGVPDLACRVPADDGTEVAVANFYALAIDDEGDLAAEDVDGDRPAFACRCAATLAEARECFGIVPTAVK